MRQRCALIPLVLFSLLLIAGCTPAEKTVTPKIEKTVRADERHGSFTSIKEEVDPFTGLAIMRETAADRQFTIYMGPKPPERPTDKLSSWPPPKTKPTVKRIDFGPVAILRKHPQGVVSNVSVISVAFNQPMIPLTSLADQRSLKVPVVITSRPKGQWRWLGTRVLSFETGTRLPQSTKYTVTVPAGTKSAAGNILDKEVTFSFETQRVAMNSTSPGRYNHHVLPESHIVLYFNQRVLAKDVAAHALLRSSKGGTMRLIPAPSKWWQQQKANKGKVYELTPLEQITLKPERIMRKDTRYTVVLPQGMKSAEGPLKSTREYTSWFNTYAPLHIKWAGCSYYGKHECYPNGTPYIHFNNNLKADAKMISAKVRITPRVKNLKMNPSGSGIYLEGEFEPDTTYRVTVRPGVEDIYQQRLRATWKGSFHVKNAHPSLQFPMKKIGVLERKNTPRFYMRGYNNLSAAQTKMVTLRPENLPFALYQARRYRSYYEDKFTSFLADSIPGEKAAFKLKINKKKNKLETRFLNPDKALRGKGGAIFIEVKSPDLMVNKWSNPFRHALVQVTDIGLSARYDGRQIIVQAHSMSTGKPFNNMTVELWTSKGISYYNHHKKPNMDKTARLSRSVKTGKDGVVIVDITDIKKTYTPYYVVGKSGKDWAFLELRGYGDDGGYASNFGSGGVPGKRYLRKFIFTDRNPYRPGEKVHLTGMLRTEDMRLKGTVEPLVDADKLKVEWTITDPRGKKMKKGTATVDKEGVFSVTYTSKKEDSVGYYNFSAKVIGLRNHYSNYIYHGFKILAYRKPEHATSVKWLGGPYILGDALKATITGKYLFGGPMAKAETKWSLRSSNAYYAPPGWPQFNFGSHYWGGSTYKSGKGKLNNEGHLDLTFTNPIPKKQLEGMRPKQYHLEAQVYDPARQSVASRASVFVHPASFYVGLRLKKNVIQRNQKNRFFVITPDIKGEALAGKKVTITATTLKYSSKAVKKGKYWGTTWVSKKVTAGTCAITSGAEPASCELTFKEGGNYTITAETADEKGRKVSASQSFYVYSEYLAPWERWRQNNRQTLEIIPDKSSYEPGESAQLLIKAPFENSVGILTVDRGGIIAHKILKLKGARTMVTIPLEEYQIPGIYVSVSLSRPRVKVTKPPVGIDDPGRPTFATARKYIGVASTRRRVAVTVTPARKVLTPGETVKVTLSTKDWQNKPVASRVALFVVDEGALSLLGFKTPDPLSSFYYSRGSGSALEDIRADLLKKLKQKYQHRNNYKHRRPRKSAQRAYSLSGGAMADAPSAAFESAPVTTASRKMAKGGMGRGGGGKSGLSFKVRKFFATTAYFNNKIYTDAEGTGTVSVKMPENLTAFRIMAVAMDKASGKSFGSSEARVNIRKQFMIRPSLPRFANFGDTFEASVVLNNLTRESGTATVKIEGIGFKLLEKAIKKVTVPAGRDREVRFKIQTLRPGRIRFRFSGFMGALTDSVEPPPLAVNVPATTEATATYGVTSKSTLQPIVPPSNANKRFGGLDIHMSSTALTGMQDAIKYLVDYPYYSSTEGLASTIAPIFSLKDILSSFQIGSIGDRATQNKRAERGIKKLVQWQKYGGGWSYWPSWWRPCAYCSTYVTWVLLRGHENGFKVPLSTLSKAARYLTRIVDGSLTWNEGGYYFSYSMRVMAGWVLSELQKVKGVNGAKDPKWLRGYMKSFYRNGLKYMPMFVKAWLMTVLHRVGDSEAEVNALNLIFQNAVVESASSVHFAESTARDLALLMHSTSRTDAIVLRSFMEVRSTDLIIPKIVKGLMKGRINGRWESTQANVYALDALQAYYKQYENEEPNFTANLWYGNGWLGKKLFKGRSMMITHKRIPISYVLKQGAKDLILSKKGEGKLYYRLGLVYVPNSLRLKPESQGFMALRTYEPMEGKDTVRKLADGTWQIKAGKMVRVRLTVVTPGQKYYVAVNDPFPAGLEPVDMSLRTSASSTYGYGGTGYRRYGYYGRGRHRYPRRSHYGRYRYGYWGWSSPSHHEMRDDRYLIFWNRMPAGTYSYSYYARATTIGRFITPPMKAHEMYEPENFGRTATDIVNVVK